MRKGTFFAGISRVLQVCDAGAFVSTSELLHRSSYWHFFLSFFPLFALGQPFPPVCSSQICALGCPAGVFTGVLRWGGEVQRKNQQSPNERSRDNMALFSLCIPHRSHSSQEMLPRPLLSLPVSCQIFSLLLNPAMEV